MAQAPTPPDAARARYPQSFGRYTLVAPLAVGGMGRLHLAVTGAPGFGKLCVVKQLRRELCTEVNVQRFLDESRVMVRLSHGNLVPVLESGTVDGQHFLAMDYVAGRDLRAVWKRLAERGERLPLVLALHVIKELCRGLGYAHEYEGLGLIHRDVGPTNVLLSYAGEVRLTDFGLVQSASDLRLKTAPGLLLGKPGYMAPEQARGEPVDQRADLYAVGVLLWELATGQRLLSPEGGLSQQLRRALNPRLRPPSTVRPDLPAALDLITVRALAPTPAGRYPDAETLRRDVALLLSELDPTTDASTLRALLATLFGDELAKEREELGLLLASVGDAQAGEGGGGDAPAGDTAPAAGADDEDDEDESAYATGDVIDDKYRIESLIGEGGMGRVYRATHVGIDRAVALKVLLPGFSQLPDVVDRFRTEARVASRIGHPHIVEVFDSDRTTRGELYYAMELLEGRDLAELLADARRLPLERAVAIAIQTCEGMEAAHQAGVIHRDLKPENVYLTERDGRRDFVKIVDFGVAKLADVEGLTLPGLLLGTAAYMAPEQAEASYDHRVDVYAVGVLLYEMLTGKLPHPDPGSTEQLMAHKSQPVLPPSVVQPAVGGELDQLLVATLDPDPDRRPQRMADLAARLRMICPAADALAPAPATATAAPVAGAGRVVPPGTLEALGAYDEDVEAFTRQEQRRGGAWVLAAVLAASLFAVLIGWLAGVGGRPDTRTGDGSPAADGTTTVEGGTEKAPRAAPRATERRRRRHKSKRRRAAPARREVRE